MILHWRLCLERALRCVLFIFLAVAAVPCSSGETPVGDSLTLSIGGERIDVRGLPDTRTCAEFEKIYDVFLQLVSRLPRCFTPAC